MRISIGLPAETLGGQPSDDAEMCSADGIAAMAQAVEHAGFHAVYVTDHPCPPAKWLRNGGHRALDPFVTLAVAATATRRVRLQTNMFIAPYRNPLLAASAIATLDAVSGGRLILGVAAGYLAGEFAAVGAEFDARNDALDDALVALRAALGGDEFTHDAAEFGYRAGGNSIWPTPALRPSAPAGPPIWIGGNSVRAMRRAVRFGDGWVPFPTPPGVAAHLRTAAIETLDDLAGRIARLRALEADAERAVPVDICVVPFGASMLDDPDAGVDSAALRGALADLESLGVGWVTLALPALTCASWIDAVGELGDSLRFVTKSGE